MKCGVLNIHRTTFFNYWVTPEVYVSDATKDRSWPLIYLQVQTHSQQCGCCELWNIELLLGFSFSAGMYECCILLILMSQSDDSRRTNEVKWNTIVVELDMRVIATVSGLQDEGVTMPTRLIQRECNWLLLQLSCMVLNSSQLTEADMSSP